MNINIDLIAKVIIPILGAIVTYILIPLIKEKTTKEQRDNIYFWVRVAVGAAEQIYQEKGQGKLKKEYVLEFLISKGINITIEELDTLIESAVAELNMAKEQIN